MKTRKHGLSEKEMELVQYLMADCKSTRDIQEKLKRLFAGTIEQMLEAETEEHLGYEKLSRYYIAAVFIGPYMTAAAYGI